MKPLFWRRRSQIRRFAPRQRIFKAGDPAEHGYVMMSGKVHVTTTDEDQQVVVVDEPDARRFLRLCVHA
jgi:CRP/FNR family cyclic AMP-dependent transcriptional regulator